MTITAAKLLVQIMGDTKGAEQAFRGVDQRLSGFADRAQQVGMQLTKYLTVPLMGAGTGAVVAAAGLDTAMRNIQSISKQTDAEIAALSDTFLDMSQDAKQTTDTATSLAAGFYDIQSSGFAGANAMKVLQASTKAASAGLTSTSVASRAIVSALNAYGLEADQATRVSDTLFKTVDIGVVSFEELATNLGDVLGTGAVAGVSIEELGAAFATMTKSGISAAESGTALNQVMLSFISPTKESADAAKELGIDLSAATLESLGLGGAMALITDKAGGNVEAISELFPNVRALKGVLSLTREEMGPFAGDLAAIGDAAGSTQAAFDIQTKSMAAQWADFRNDMTGIAIDIGTALVPTLVDLKDAVMPVFDAFNDLDDSQKKNIVSFGLLAGAIGPVTWALGIAADNAMALFRALTSVAGVAGNVFTALGTGSALVPTTAKLVGTYGKLAVTLGSVGVIVASLAAIWYSWNKNITKTNEAGKEAVGGALADFFENQVKSGMDANQVIEEYLAAIGRMQAAKGDAGIAGWFVDLSGAVKDSGKALAEVMAQTGGSYRDYAAAVLQAQVATGKYSEETKNGILQALDQGQNIDWVITKLGGLERAWFGLPKFVPLLNKSLQSATGEAAEMAAVFGDVDVYAQAAATGLSGLSEETQKIIGMPAADILSSLGQALSDQAWSAMDAKAANDSLAISLGYTTEAQLKLADDTQLVVDAFAAGVISAERLAVRMDQAQDGTLNLSEAQRNSLQAATDHANALHESAVAANDAYLSQLNLAQSLKDATSAQIAQAAIGALTEAMKKGGTEDAPAFLTAIAGVQEAFGLSDEKSRALAEGIGLFTGALETGQLPAENYAGALETLISDAQDGVVDFDAIIKSFQNTPAAATEAEGAFGLAGEALLTLGEEAFTTTGLIEDAFIDKNWQGLGTSISDGIAAGIDAGIPVIQAAAIAAAQAALAAAEAELDINTPSKAAARQIGKPFMEGIAKGVRDNMALPYAAITESSAGMLNTGAVSYSNTVNMNAQVSREIDIYVLAHEVAAEIKRSRL